MSIEAALEWIENHREDLQIMEEERLMAQSIQRSLNKQKSSQSEKAKDGSGLKELDIDQFNTEFKTPLKNLFKQHLLSGLYGKFKDRLPELTVLCIERYDK